MIDPYRKRGEPAVIPKELRRWFTKSSDVEKGPYEASALKRSYKDGYIKATTLVRAEDESDWRELASVPELRLPGMPPSATSPNLRPPVISTPTPQFIPSPPLSGGTFWGGFIASLFFGLLALIVVYASSKEPETRRGARTGFFVRLGLSVMVIVVRLATSRT